MTKEPEVHIDWRMTPNEWKQLKKVLYANLKVPYLAALKREGKI